MTLGVIGITTTAAIMAGALNYDKIPFINFEKHYQAYFAEAGGLQVGAPVQVAGYRVGKVTSIDLDGDRVLVGFDIDDDISLGNRTEANIRTKTLLGAKLLEITSRGADPLDGPVPLERTKPPYQLPDALGDLSMTISGLNTDKVSDALATLSQTFRDTPPQLRAAVDGLARFSDTIASRDEQLRTLLENANKATSVLSGRADQISQLVHDTNALLVELQAQSAALDDISGNMSAFARQMEAFVAENRAQLKPSLEKLNGVLTIVDNRKDRLKIAIKLLNNYALSLGETVASGPFFKAYVANLLPGQYLQPFIDAAFSDLGLDPNVKLPSELSDPQTGQPGTPPLPMPFPRTGQGGEPRMTIPDAITGNPGDQPCGPPGIPLPGPGCYPARDIPAAPPPGGPPPGPPALPPPGQESVTDAIPSAVFHPAPNEVPSQGSQPNLQESGQ